MIPNRHHMIGRKQYADAVAIGAFSGTTGAISWPVGTQTGDMAVVSKRGTPPSGWTSTPGMTSPLGVGLYYRYVTADVLASPPTPGSYFCGAVYREPLLLTERAHHSTQGPPGSAPGFMPFTKSPHCAGRLAIAVVREGFGAATVESPFTLRTFNNDGVIAWRIYDHLNSAAFVSGTGVTCTWDVTDTSGPGWAMYEFTN